MDTKANLNNRKKINELAIQHNKLTTLVACLLNEVSNLKKELTEYKVPASNDSSHQTTSKQSGSGSSAGNNSRQQFSNKFGNINDLRAEDILKQLSINNLSDN